MSTRFLTLPVGRFSSIDFLIDTVPDWHKAEQILISITAYKKMGIDPFLGADGNIWIRNEVTFGNRHNPAMSYELKKIKFDLWAVVWIKYGGVLYEFSTKTSYKSIYITTD